MRKLFFTLICSLLSFVNFAQNEELFEEANKAYQEGDYETAAITYEKILENDVASSELYYNLGNAYYKLNKVAESIYFFEKALQLDPGDEDIINNIAFARNMAIDDIQTVDKSGFSQWMNEIISIFRFSTWAIMAIIFSVAFVVFFLFYYFSHKPFYKRISFGVALFSVFLCIVALVFAFHQRSYIENNKFAIVFSEEAEVRDEPNPRGATSFELHEGTKAKVLEDFQGWTKIELANGSQGWISSEAIRKL